MLKEAIGRPLERPQEGEASSCLGEATSWRVMRGHKRPRAEIGHELR